MENHMEDRIECPYCHKMVKVTVKVASHFPPEDMILRCHNPKCNWSGKWAETKSDGTSKLCPICGSLELTVDFDAMGVLNRVKNWELHPWLLLEEQRDLAGREYMASRATDGVVAGTEGTGGPLAARYHRGTVVAAPWPVEPE